MLPSMKHRASIPAPSSQALRRLIAVAFTLAVTAAACGSDSDSSLVSAATGDTTSAAAETNDAETSDAETAEGATGESAPSGEGADVRLFIDGALAEDILTVDCTLSDGTETSCHQITVTGYPADGDVGPFCPTTTSDTADQVGIWLDGDNVYDIDGQFILDLPEIYNDDNWHLHDDEGQVHVTDTPEAFEAAARPDVAEEYQNHCVEGQIAWLDGGEPITSTIEIPTTPVAGDSVTQAGDSLGVTLNGVIIAGQAPVDAILGAYTIAAFDDCGGHINPFDGYHLHGATGCSEVGEASDGEAPMFAIALDGYAVHSPLGDTDEAAADLDQCNGHVTDEIGYHYHANNAEENAVLTCFTGKTTAAADAGGRPGGPPPQG